MNERASLPDPDRAALERSARLVARIQAEIAAAPAGVIAFERFMALALYTPGLGYYAADQPIFGRAGDFITAPESGELFGACVARQAAEVLARTGPDLVEYGAGSGRLAATLIEALAPRCPELRYHIVEPSAALRARQRELIAARVPAQAARVSWSETHPARGVDGLVIANEVLDAMPAKRYRVERGAVVELGVGRRDAGFAWQACAAPANLPPELAARLAACGEGYVYDHLPQLERWCKALRGVVRRGVALVIDYGYPRHEMLHPARRDGTLKCHYRHHVHDDPFFHPGLQDITVSVDFTALAEAAARAGFRVAGFTTLARFLLACGIETAMTERLGAGAAADYTLAQEGKRLLLPGEMGEVVKGMALALDYDAPLAGFADDQRHRLDGFERT